MSTGVIPAKARALDPGLRGDDDQRPVVPAQAGTQGSPGNARRALSSEALDPRLRGDDGTAAKAGTQGSPGNARRALFSARGVVL